VGPSDDQIQTAVEERCRRRGGLVLTPDDFVIARASLLFELNYESIAEFALGGDKQYLGDRNKKCRYCLRSSPEVAFQRVAHAIPECLGNHSLISNDECDSCNKLFSQSVEHHLDSFTRPIRTLSVVKGKNNVPSYKSKDGTVRIDFDSKERCFEVVDVGPETALVSDHENRKFKIETVCEPFVPLEVYRCIVKMGYALLPDGELAHFEDARRWLVEPKVQLRNDPSVWAQGLYCTLPIDHPNQFAVLYRRRWPDEPLPYILFCFSIASVLFQFPLPLSPSDDHLNGLEIDVPRMDLAYQGQGGDCRWQALALRSRERRTDATLKVDFTYDSEDTIDQSRLKRLKREEDSA
jgi:hypothetical protein